MSIRALPTSLVPLMRETERRLSMPPRREANGELIYPGYVYLCYNRRNGFTKIGFSKSPVLRERTLQSEEPEVLFIFVFAGCLDDERILQSRFAQKRLRGEWFALTVRELVKLYKSLAWLP